MFNFRIKLNLYVSPEQMKSSMDNNFLEIIRMNTILNGNCISQLKNIRFIFSLKFFHVKEEKNEKKL